MQNNGFDGIPLKPAPTPNPDGSYIIKLTPQQWSIFQENQKRPPVSVPADAAPVSVAPDGESVSATKDPRRFLSLDSMSLSSCYDLKFVFTQKTMRLLFLQKILITSQF